MKAVPLPFEEFRGKGVLDLGGVPDSFSLPQEEVLLQLQKWNTQKEHCYVGTEPTSVLDVARNPSPPTSSSTLSSSRGSSGGGVGSTDSSTGAAARVSDNHPPQPLEAAQERCGLGMEDWESVLSESHGQDQSILRLIMGDIEDPAVGLSKLLQTGTAASSQDVEFNGGFTVMDQSSVLDPISSANFAPTIDTTAPGNYSDFPFRVVNPSPFPASATNNLSPVSLFHSQQQQQQQPIESIDEKPHVNPQFFLNQNQAQFMQNPALFMPVTFATQLQEHHQLQSQPPPAKRLNCGPIGVGANFQLPKSPFLDSGQDLFLRRQQQQFYHLQQQHQQRPPMVVTAAAAAVPKQKIVSPNGEDLATHQLQQALTDQLSKAAELIETGNPELAQGILARLNHQLSPIGKPFQRAAFYIKETLQLLPHSNPVNNSNSFSPTGLIWKIGAYKSFSEISPLLQFANFTCNQALLEAVDGSDRVHIVDFDIGFGGQWASFMQELALRNGGAPSLKITAFVSPSNHDQIELSFTEENLKQYASEINMPFELEVLTLESLNPASWPQPLGDCEAIAVNLPVASFANYPSYLPLVLRFVKQLMPKIVVTLDRNCDRIDLPFAQFIIQVLGSYSALLESLDAASVNPDVIQMIEKFFLQPATEKLVMGRSRLRERAHPWKNLLMTCGFAPFPFSNFTESQAECLVQRSPGRGFHVEKMQSSLVLCWQRKELISVSTWRC
ncbi:hypothetical protein L6164_000731 [Bauhinia variegata]|uniref:Uncharacterized protein n=1 Tax=Bauhinia variegata TaxID=167791 RepID=A0ACB9Q7I9_BAUVA|nr:hypothetical protein L6164_000731 [Bauhinia variegata]